MKKEFIGIAACLFLSLGIIGISCSKKSSSTPTTTSTGTSTTGTTSANQYKTCFPYQLDYFDQGNTEYLYALTSDNNNRLSSYQKIRGGKGANEYYTLTYLSSGNTEIDAMANTSTSTIDYKIIASYRTGALLDSTYVKVGNMKPDSVYQYQLDAANRLQYRTFVVNGNDIFYVEYRYVGSSKNPSQEIDEHFDSKGNIVKDSSINYTWDNNPRAFAGKLLTRSDYAYSATDLAPNNILTASTADATGNVIRTRSVSYKYITNLNYVSEGDITNTANGVVTKETIKYTYSCK